MRCQFCGAPIAGVQRPPDAYKYRIDERRQWEEYAYYVLAVIWILMGAYKIAQGLGYVPNVLFAIGGGGFLGVIGGVNVAIGLGLLFEAGWAQFLVKWLSILNLVFGVLGYLYAFMPPNSHHLAAFLAAQTFSVALAGFQLYIIDKVGDA